MGRFYVPGNVFGRPHASSTGIYLEGLIDAFWLARELGDIKRTENYRVAILRGLRSLMQLQYADQNNLFYVSGSQQKYALGGIRTNNYDNTVRIDNVAHGLAAMIKVLGIFRETDYLTLDGT